MHYILFIFIGKFVVYLIHISRNSHTYFSNAITGGVGIIILYK